MKPEIIGSMRSTYTIFLNAVADMSGPGAITR